MNNLQYARVGAVRPKGNYVQTTRENVDALGLTNGIVKQEASLNNNLQNNISCK
jgi:hypothetical protein